jgi:plasmid maintenance system antidote protein VapI
MKNRKVRNFAEFALWTKTRMLERGISQRELAAGMGTHQARISEAIAAMVDMQLLTSVRYRKSSETWMILKTF